METVQEHFNKIANEYDSWKKKNWYYYKNLKGLYRELIPEGSEVLEAGCGTGEVLEYLKPKRGVGFDISEKMIDIANQKYKDQKNLFFVAGTAENLNLSVKFDYIFLADVIEHLDNVNSSLSALKKFCHQDTKLIISMINPLWEIPFLILEKLKLKMPEGPHYRISISKLKEILSDNGFQVFQEDFRVILPTHVPFVSDFLNKYFYKLPLVRRMCLIYFCQASLK